MSWLVDKKGAFLVDRIMFFEHIEADFSDLAAHLGLSKDVKLPHVNITKRTDYRDYYDDDNLKRRVEALYAPDFEAFGYEFDAPFPKKYPFTEL